MPEMPSCSCICSFFWPSNRVEDLQKAAKKSFKWTKPQRKATISFIKADEAFEMQRTLQQPGLDLQQRQQVQHMLGLANLPEKANDAVDLLNPLALLQHARAQQGQAGAIPRT